jgi:hypothetical protein
MTGRRAGARVRRRCLTAFRERVLDALVRSSASAAAGGGCVSVARSESGRARRTSRRRAGDAGAGDRPPRPPPGPTGVCAALDDALAAGRMPVGLGARRSCSAAVASSCAGAAVRLGPPGLRLCRHGWLRRAQPNVSLRSARRHHRGAGRRSPASCRPSAGAGDRGVRRALVHAARLRLRLVLAEETPHRPRRAARLPTEPWRAPSRSGSTRDRSPPAAPRRARSRPVEARPLRRAAG